MTDFMNIVNITIGLIALVALIISIMAYNHTTTQTHKSTFDGQVIGPDGKQIGYKDAMPLYLNDPQGNDFLGQFLLFC